MGRRIKERILIEEESSATVKVYRRVWEDIPDKPAPKPVSKPKAEAKPKAAPKPKAVKKKKEE
jgi:hypothetical protein